MELKGQDIKTYLFGGKSTITLQSTVTNDHFTYKIKKHKEKDLYFVQYLHGRNNETDFSFFGTIFGKEGNFVLSKKSKLNKDSKVYLAFKWFYKNLNNSKKLEMLRVFHNGTCGRCGRKLTTPESVKNGFGPECVKKR